MLYIDIEKKEIFDDKTQTFKYINPCTIQMEHSLLSIKKWESKWHKSYLSTEEKTAEEVFDYMRCMTINSVDESVFYLLSDEDLNKINDYIADPMTATTFNEKKIQQISHKKEIITAEIIYYWMICYNIPIECQKWHINQLITLIKVCRIKTKEDEEREKNNGKAKRITSEQAAKRREINAKRRSAMNTKG